MTVHIANDVFNAGRNVERYKPNIVMIDLSLPGLNITDLCKSLKEGRNNELRIITMHDMRRSSAEDRALSKGAELLLPKPIKLKELQGFLDPAS